MNEIEKEVKITKEEAKDLLEKTYNNLIQILHRYLVLKEEQYKIIALWIIGTYFHDKFYSYPFLFFNAMKGSGKSRSIKLITYLAKDGQVMLSPTEATLFRMTGTLGIDEAEGIANKEKASIRELLNASYKKGTKVFRMKKVKTATGSEQQVEEFEPYRPIVLANIYGMEEVLGDRCIQLILDKSDDASRTKLVEAFDCDEVVTNTLKMLKKCSLCSVVMKKNIYMEWNNYIINEHTTTLTTYTTTNTLTTQTTSTQYIEFFKLIDNSGIYGRNLELFMPMFLISNFISKDLVLENIEIAKKLIEDTKHEEEVENKDILLIEFIAGLDVGISDYYLVKDLTHKFKEQFDLLDDEDVNPKWFGKSLKRLNLIIDKRRRGRGIEVLTNSVKAKEKLKMFKNDTKKNL